MTWTPQETWATEREDAAVDLYNADADMRLTPPPAKVTGRYRAMLRGRTMLTKEELANMRSYFDGSQFEPTAAFMWELFNFAEQMLPLRDALLVLLAAKARLAVERAKFRLSPDVDGEYHIHRASTDDFAARKKFWELACELAETETTSPNKETEE